MEETNSRFKTYAMVAAGIVLFGLLVFGLERLATKSDQAKTTPMQSTENDTKVRGNADAPVTLLVYSDFQCPACAAYEPFLAKLMQEFPDKLKIVYRYFPLETIHKNALISAQAAEAAHRQGKFWEMHDQLFRHQTDWAQSENPTDSFQSYAQTIDLNMDRFNTDIADVSVNDTVKADQELGNDANIPGTPSFFLNGKKLDGPQSYEAFEKVIGDETAKAQR